MKEATVFVFGQVKTLSKTINLLFLKNVVWDSIFLELVKSLS